MSNEFKLTQADVTDYADSIKRVIGQVKAFSEYVNTLITQCGNMLEGGPYEDKSVEQFKKLKTILEEMITEVQGLEKEFTTTITEMAKFTGINIK